MRGILDILIKVIFPLCADSFYNFSNNNFESNCFPSNEKHLLPFRSLDKPKKRDILSIYS